MSYTPPGYLNNNFNVSNNGSGNYVINGQSNPTLTLTQGETYTFTVIAIGHPFWIKTSLSTGTANQYNTGVTDNGTDNGVITFVVPYTAPSTLYYNCQFHASMAGGINIITVPVPPPVPPVPPTPAPSSAFTPYNFPDQPFDGQIYPNPAIPGTFQYRYIQARTVWVLVSGVVQQVLGNEPIVITGTASAPTVNIRPATPAQPGSLSAADKQKLDSIPDTGVGSVTRVNTGAGLTGGPIVTSGTLSLLPPSGPNIGGVKAGQGVTILEDGTLESFSGVTSITAGTGLGGGTILSSGTIFLRPPTGGVIGGVKAGNNVTIASDGTISAAGGQGSTGAFVILDNLTPLFNGVRTQFPATVNGGLQTITTAANLFLVLGGVLQPSPVTFIVINNEEIKFTSPPPTGTQFSGRLFIPNGQSFQQLDDIAPQFNGVATSFPMRVGGQIYQPASAASLFVGVGGVLQTPNDSYNVSGSNIVFSSAPPTGATFNGQVLGI